jgi:hypothetical protein
VTLDDSTLAVVALAAAGAATLGLLLAIAAHLRIGRLRRSYSLLQGRGDEASFVEVVGRQTEEVAGLRAEVGDLQGDLARVRTDLADALRHVAVVRYDAFGDMGGHLSWSLALLDDGGNGVVLTSIHGRSEARTYAKNITAWTCEQQLSPEEQEAVTHARP